MSEWFDDLKADFILCFIDDERWRFLLSGLQNTLIITFFALLIGVAIGALVAIVRATHDKTIDTMRRSPRYYILKVLNSICKVYLTVIRGTPVVVQLLIMYFVVLASVRNGVTVAIITFGINSGAYVAEIVRGGIMSIDNGQSEAGRSLGFSYVQTMVHIVIPQAVKNILPSLANEFIVLLKETSIVGYVAITDLTKAANIIVGRTFVAFLPLFAAAAAYLILVMFFTWLVGKLERRLRTSDSAFQDPKAGNTGIFRKRRWHE